MVAQSPVASARTQPETPLSTSDSMTVRRVSLPSRMQSIPAADTSGWTRVEDGKWFIVASCFCSSTEEICFCRDLLVESYR